MGLLGGLRSLTVIEAAVTTPPDPDPEEEEEEVGGL